jgi:negative regulator of sigma E activity
MVMEKMNEDLSALHDGEIDELSAVRLLRSLDQKPELLDEWSMYSVIGEALRHNEPVTHVGVKGAQRALAAIAQEPIPKQKPASRGSASVKRSWVPLAIAASLAVLAIGVTLETYEPVRSASMAVLERGGIVLADSRPVDQEEMDRYADLHREVAVPGLQRASLVSSEWVGGPQGR